MGKVVDRVAGKGPAKRNPVAPVARQMRPQVVRSGKEYKRRPKHRGDLTDR